MRYGQPSAIWMPRYSTKRLGTVAFLVALLPNGSRLSCGALRKDSFLNLRVPESFKRLLGRADSYRKCNRPPAAGQGSLVAHSHARLPLILAGPVSGGGGPAPRERRRRAP